MTQVIPRTPEIDAILDSLDRVGPDYARGDPLPKVVPPGAKNPLGDYKMRLAVGDGTYEIHETNNPVAVGLAVTHGCIRMYPEDLAALFASVPIGTKVWLINEPVKIAYVDGKHHEVTQHRARRLAVWARM